MKYAINRTRFKDFDVYEMGKRAARAYFIPYSSSKKLMSTPYEKERVSSDMVRLLSGEWDFRYYEKKSELPRSIETSAIQFDKINVPSTWQRTGYEPPVYLNCPYPFDDKPPKLPDEMSVGVYRKLFDIASLDKNYIIAFLGVVPCIDLYINGKHVGYSEGAHNTAEFDVTDFVCEGENELVAVVFKWSTGTFLECQDMFRENGIFRDVLLYEMPQTYINDYKLVTCKKDEKYSLSADVAINGAVDGYTVKASLQKDGKVIAEQVSDASELTSIEFEGLDVTEWNAELPTLYELVISLKKGRKEIEAIRNFTGFRTIKIDGTAFTVNGKKIKIKGVNHHDSQHQTGYVMSIEDLLKDIKLMKSLNVNGVRTSHYPPDAQFLTLCDIYGLYVIDEADIETHGCDSAPHHNINLISHDARWIPRYLDRVSRMYYRDRNHPSIIMWSLGNEAGGYICQDACFEFLHKECPQIPVHYEGVIRTERKAYDVVSEMYTHPNDLMLVKNRKRGNAYTDKPFFLCEYCHAMGVGPGALEEYWDIMYSDDIFMGGCIWEWTDHAVYHKDGELEYTYGGDHGEKKHDGNFCVDGLVYPDRTPHTGAYEMKAVYRPVRAYHTGYNTFSFKNTNRFRATDYITFGWELLHNGIKELDGKFELLLQPEEQKEITLSLPELTDGEYHINFIYSDGDKEIAKEQIALRECLPEIKLTSSEELVSAGTSEELVISFSGGKLIFNKKTGMLCSYVVNGKELLNSENTALVPNVFRAPTDNDCPRFKWREEGLDRAETKLVNFDFSVCDTHASVNASFDIIFGNECLFNYCAEYTVLPHGAIHLTSKLSPRSCKSSNDMARFGVTLQAVRTLENVEYYGLGERENLPDFKAQSTVGVYKTTVDAMYEPYIKPQDNGNRSQVRFVKLTDCDGDGIVFEASGRTFSFSAHHFSQKLLQDARHREDLHDENMTFVSVDGFVRGAGTASCGPDVLEKYKLDIKDGLEFSVMLSPVVGGKTLREAPSKQKKKTPVREKICDGIKFRKAPEQVYDTKFIPRASCPEEVGISSDAVLNFTNAMNESGMKYHAFMILRDGKVAAECYRYPFNAKTPHIMYSISKSVTSCAVGFAIDEGYFTLDTTVAEIFPELVVQKDSDKFKKITVRHLLTMTAGKFPSYMLDKTKGNWAKQFAESDWYGEPGEKFKYINENVYMLCAIIKKTTGMSVSKFLTPRLWEPLGITTPYWETDENGVESGGWGIFLTSENLAKFILTYLDGGKFENKQIIPKSWVDASLTIWSNKKSQDEYSGYGYCFWMRKRNEAHAAGFFGQIGEMYREENIAMIMISGDTSDAPAWKAMDNFREEWRAPDDAKAVYDKRLDMLKSLSIDTVPFSNYRSPLEKKISGKTILFKKAVTANLFGFPPSVLPVVAVYMTKDRAGNIDKVKFKVIGNELVFQWTEGDETCCIICGLDGRYRTSKIYLAGTRYTTFAAARWINDNSLEITVRPVESVGKRVMTFCFNGNNVALTTYTDPSIDEILGTVRSFIEDIFSTKKGKEIGGKLFVRIKNKVQPVLKGKMF